MWTGCHSEPKRGLERRRVSIDKVKASIHTSAPTAEPAKAAEPKGYGVERRA